jgi:hypothetical protein
MRRLICRVIGHNIKESADDWSRCTRCKRRYIDIASERMGRQIGRLTRFARERDDIK